MDKVIDQAIEEGKCPGGVLWLEHAGETYEKAYGWRSIVPKREPMTKDTRFDVASLTKVVATSPAVLLLVERGHVFLDAPVASYVPEFKGNGKEKVSVRHLLTHTSGLRAGIESSGEWTGCAAAINKACEGDLLSAPGTAYRYSDINFILLGELVRRVSGMSLDEFVTREIYGPLQMTETGFLPSKESLGRIAPTEVVDSNPLRGVVHDPVARRMGGVAGHAGLFTTAHDLARYARMLLNEGVLDGIRIFKPDTVRLMTSVQTPPLLNVRRGLGWDIDSPYSAPRGSRFPIGSYGHTGWTGASLWIDPFSRTFVIFLSNRNHPTEAGNVVELRRTLGTLAAQAINGFDMNAPRNQSLQNPVNHAVVNGIDVLKKLHFEPLKGMRIGLITNHTGQDRKRNPTIDLLNEAPNVKLVALFSPEHGIRGEFDEKIKDSADEKTGLPIYSLYGDSREPTPDQLKTVDALVFDIQDIGCRFYTYISTMGLAIKAAGEHGKKFFVLDRVNPINGKSVEGPVISGETSFVGFHPIPLRHGMTVGELARMFNVERKFGADLTVIPLENWKRGMWFDETVLPWTNPSPNMRNLKAAILYPGIGLLERAVSVGRGTDTPFEVVGAPYINDTELAMELNRKNLPGVRFVPIRFTPKSSVYKGQDCGGIYILLTDRDSCNVVALGIQIALTLTRLYSESFDPDKMQHLLLSPETLSAIKSLKSLSAIRENWRSELDSFQERRSAFLLY